MFTDFGKIKKLTNMHVQRVFSKGVSPNLSQNQFFSVIIIITLAYKTKNSTVTRHYCIFSLPGKEKKNKTAVVIIILLKKKRDVKHTRAYQEVRNVCF